MIDKVMMRQAMRNEIAVLKDRMSVNNGDIRSLVLANEELQVRIEMLQVELGERSTAIVYGVDPAFVDVEVGG